MTTSADQQTEEVLVLYGSSTGNSESAAHEIASLLPTQLSPAKIAEHNGPANLALTARVLSLDDFLEVEKAKWTRLVIIVTSSYGVGQAPMGARKFRDVCDEILERHGVLPDDDKSNNKNNAETRFLLSQEKILSGVTFAMLGLGDSHYTTFFRNPTVLEEALTTVGATRVGELGKADASGTGEEEQSKVIERWIQGIWKDLAIAVASDPPPASDLEKAREETWKLCLDLFPDWKPTNYRAMIAVCLPLTGVIIGILVHLFFFGWGKN